MIRAITRFLIVSTILILAACSYSVRLKIDSIERATDLSQLSTYRWDNSALGEMAPDEMRTTEFDKILRQEMEDSLATKGYRKVEGDSADFTIDYRLTLKTQVAEFRDENPSEYDANPYELLWRLEKGEKPVFTGVNEPEKELEIYQKGTLHVGAFDKTGILTWHVSADKVLNERHTESEHGLVLRKIMRRIMGHFPARE